MNLQYYVDNKSGAICLIIGMLIAMTLFILLIGPVHNLVKAKVIKLCGDDWVEEAGYFSLHPINSFHWVGAFSTFLVFMGFTKRVRYRKRYLDAPVIGTFFISLSGVLTYFLFAMLFIFLLALIGNFNFYGMTNPSVMPETELPFMGCVFHTLFSAVFFLSRICSYSAVFNLLPIPPMDMGEMLFTFFSKHWADEVKKHDMLFSIGIFLLAFFALGMPNSFMVQTSIDIIDFFQNAFLSFINLFF